MRETRGIIQVADNGSCVDWNRYFGSPSFVQRVM